MWPCVVDMTRDESTRVLRRLELEAYSTIVDVFRAQGFLTKDKKHLLEELQGILSISSERHRAEVRRAVNDEHLTTIADYLVGPNNNSEWMQEGRRLVPLMPRLVPQTQFTPVANHVTSVVAERNVALPLPAQTGVFKEASVTVTAQTSSLSTQTPPAVVKTEIVTSPSNVVVLPSGKSIHIKGGLNTDDEGLAKKRRKRSISGELSQIHVTARPLLSPPVSRISYATASTNTTHGVSPMKITITKTAVTRTQTTAVSGQTQKVIIVSSAGQLSTTNTTQHRTFPLIKAIPSTTVSTTYVTRTPAQAIAANQSRSLGHMITTPLPASTGTSSTSSGWAPATTVYPNPVVSGPRPRGKTIIRHRAPHQAGQMKPGVVMSLGPQAVTPSITPTTHHVQMRPATTKPAIHVRPEHGLKIISQNKPVSPSHIIPRTQLTASTTSGAIIVVSCTSHASTVTSTPRPISAFAHATGLTSKTLSITNQGGKVIATSSKGSNVVTVNPKTLHLTAVKSTTGSKPNVIVVQKGGVKKTTSASGATATVITKPSGMPSSAFEKELVSFIQKQEPRGVIVTTTVQSDASGKQLPVVQIQRSRPEVDLLGGKNTSLLAELIQAAALDTGSGGGEKASGYTQQKHPEGGRLGRPPGRTGAYTRGGFPSSVSEDAAAIRALVEMQSQGKDSTVGSSGDSAADSLYNLEQTLKAISAQEQQRHTPTPAQSTAAQSTVQPRKYIHNVSLLSKSSTQRQSDTTQGQSDTTQANATRPLKYTISKDIVQNTLPKVSVVRNVDLLSESLASAQIDLDPYEFMDEDSSSGGGYVPEEASVAELNTALSPAAGLSSGRELDVQAPDSGGAVAVVRSDMDTSVMNLEDFSSQRVFTTPDFCDVISATDDMTDNADAPADTLAYQSSTDETADAGDSPSHRLSKRKRKPPALFDDEFTEISTWVRPALSLLNRVCHFRGQNRDKDALDAAHWFIHPVDSAIAPDYDKIVKTPMDLSKIRRKLEMNVYGTPDDFHSDMLLIYRNCLLYNPPGHSARHDCEELFGFYVDEYTRLLTKLTKPSLSPSHKRIKFDRSPTKL